MKNVCWVHVAEESPVLNRSSSHKSLFFVASFSANNSPKIDILLVKCPSELIYVLRH